jgi:hypothetical protein
MTWAEPTEPTSCPVYKLIRNQLLRAYEIEQGHRLPLTLVLQGTTAQILPSIASG